MSRLHGFAISLLLAVAAGTGSYAMMVTAKLGKAASKPEVASAAAIKKQTKQLNQWNASIAKSLTAKPPALPGLPQYAPVTFFSLPQGQTMPVVATTTPAARTQASQSAAATESSAPVKTESHSGIHQAGLTSTLLGLSAPKTQHKSDSSTHTTTQTTTTTPSTYDFSRTTPTPEVVTPAPQETPAPAPVTTTTTPAPPITTTTATTTTTTTTGLSARQLVEQQCQALMQAVSGGTEAQKQAAEHQCEALKNSLERHG